MSKRKHTPEWMINRVEEYLSGQGSIHEIATANGIGATTLQHWIYRYMEQGTAGFAEKTGNAKYSKEFKIHCVEAAIRGEGSVDDLVAKYNISDRWVLRDWIKKYNANMELKDYDPKREVYMAEARRKTTQGERKEIVEYCISHGRDYKNTAAHYDVSYSQVYTWVKKYTAYGEAGLVDRRGHHKTDEEVNELERLRRENLRLKRQLEEKDMLVELLKKVKEFEGR
ncbi:MAG: helix-turn-helix domain-containing protein [Oscillospiraceae bacterium]|nr:helix-turn-helix domain-containing protein [Oscillospiraceae bacterium]